MKIRTNITVDLWNPSVPPYVNVKQGDSQREIAVTLTAGGNEINPEVIPDIYIKKPDGTLIYNSCTLEGATIVIPLTAQSLAAAGEAKAELQMTYGDGVLSTPIFNLTILPTNIDDQAVESTNEFGALQTALQEVEELKENGLKGDAATIQIGTVTTGAEGSDASVTNSGTAGDAILDFVIPRGNTGNGINSESAAVEYQQSDSGTEIPSGTWSQNIPEVANGSYLWTRTTIPYTDGNSTVSYSVSKMGETGPVGSTEANMDMVVTYDTPADYTAPASGDALNTWLGKATRGLSNLFSSLASKLDSSKVLSETQWNTGTVAERGYLADAKDILDEFGKVNTDIAGKQPTITGGASSIASSDLSASRALVSDVSGKVAVSTVTAAELGYLGGVTSGIQTQLNGKQPSLTYTTGQGTRNTGNTSNGSLGCRKYGRQVTVDINLSITNFEIGTLLGQLPSGFRPVADTYEFIAFCASNTTKDAFLGLKVQANGNIYIGMSIGSHSSGDWYHAFPCFISAN